VHKGSIEGCWKNIINCQINVSSNSLKDLGRG
jgi:hypothetical protein